MEGTSVGGRPEDDVGFRQEVERPADAVGPHVGDVRPDDRRPLVPRLEGGFEEGDAKIFRRELFRMEASLKEGVKSGAEEIIVAMHYPPTNEKKQPSEFTAMFEKYGVTNVYYGHLHGKENFSRGIEGNLNGVEYKLISIDKLNFTLWKIR